MELTQQLTSLRQERDELHKDALTQSQQLHALQQAYDQLADELKQARHECETLRGHHQKLTSDNKDVVQQFEKELREITTQRDLSLQKLQSLETQAGHLENYLFVCGGEGGKEGGRKRLYIRGKSASSSSPIKMEVQRDCQQKYEFLSFKQNQQIQLDDNKIEVRQSEETGQRPNTPNGMILNRVKELITNYLEAYQQMKSSLLSENQMLRQQIATATSERATLQEQIRQKDGEYKKLKDQCQHHMSELQQIQSKSTANMEEYQKAYEQWDLKKSEYDKKILDLQLECDAIKFELTAKGTIEDANNVQELNQHLESLKMKYEKRIESIKQQFSEKINVMNVTVTKLNNMQTKLLKETQHLTIQLKQKEMDYDEYERKCREFENELNNSKNAWAGKENKLRDKYEQAQSQSKQELESMKSDIQSLENEKKELEKKIESLVLQMTEVSQERDTLQNQLQVTKDTLTACCRERNQMEEKLHDATQQLQTTKQDCETLHSVMFFVNQELSEKQSKTLKDCQMRIENALQQKMSVDISFVSNSVLLLLLFYLLFISLFIFYLFHLYVYGVYVANVERISKLIPLFTFEKHILELKELQQLHDAKVKGMECQLQETMLKYQQFVQENQSLQDCRDQNQVLVKQNQQLQKQVKLFHKKLDFCQQKKKNYSRNDNSKLSEKIDQHYSRIKEQTVELKQLENTLKNKDLQISELEKKLKTIHAVDTPSPPMERSSKQNTKVKYDAINPQQSPPKNGKKDNIKETKINIIAIACLKKKLVFTVLSVYSSPDSPSALAVEEGARSAVHPLDLPSYLQQIITEIVSFTRYGDALQQQCLKQGERCKELETLSGKNMQELERLTKENVDLRGEIDDFKFQLTTKSKHLKMLQKNQEELEASLKDCTQKLELARQQIAQADMFFEGERKVPIAKKTKIFGQIDNNSASSAIITKSEEDKNLKEQQRFDVGNELIFQKQLQLLRKEYCDVQQKLKDSEHKNKQLQLEIHQLQLKLENAESKSQTLLCERDRLKLEIEKQNTLLNQLEEEQTTATSTNMYVFCTKNRSIKKERNQFLIMEEKVKSAQFEMEKTKAKAEKLRSQRDYAKEKYKELKTKFNMLEQKFTYLARRLSERNLMSTAYGPYDEAMAATSIPIPQLLNHVNAVPNLNTWKNVGSDAQKNNIPIDQSTEEGGIVFCFDSILFFFYLKNLFTNLQFSYKPHISKVSFKKTKATFVFNF
ncbi:viral A-type inclusion protein [Reticulomyxa filosa]|uniref:Viral A-type inclusion protein n=1 Tax=Reticulomyxa filosa TaxID=46433 RepID=X6NNP8_RETFI|nr:viral A-type inclusion protein [Reticulomyxa filosa]|eukprot:ETO27636.1 viral A-type inclusion protein [Reticulomyxa filosa]